MLEDLLHLTVDAPRCVARVVWMQLSAFLTGASWRALTNGGPLPFLRFHWEHAVFLYRLHLYYLLETARDSRRGYPVLSAELPHVDTIAGRDQKQRPVPTMQGGGASMMHPSAPQLVMRDLVLVGAGHSHAYVIKNLGMRPVLGVRVTLITRDVDTPYSGMLPGYVAGVYSRAECHLDVVRLAQFAKATFVKASVVGLDRERRLIFVDDGRPPIPYDVVSIDIGSSPRMLPGLDKQPGVTSVKPITRFDEGFARIRERVRDRSGRGEQTTIAVVGGGPSGVELTLAMEYRLRRDHATSSLPNPVRWVLLSRTSAVCPNHNRSVQETFARILRERGIDVQLNCSVTGVVHAESALPAPLEVVCSNSRRFAAHEVLWCTQATTQEWLRASGLAVDGDGFMRVRDTLESENTANVFGAGDCANVVPHPRPKAGVFAVRQGPPLAQNLRAALRGDALEPFEPQSVFLGIIGTGEPYAVASKGELCLEGAWLWDLKDWIDRKWMAGYTSHLPMMEDATELSEPALLADMGVGANATQGESDLVCVARAAGGADALRQLREVSMRCGGCGAKVGASVLESALAGVAAGAVRRPEVVAGLGAPEDCALVRALPPPEPSPLLVHTVDFFRSFISDPYVFGQVVANHAMSDVHAMGADCVSALAIVVVPYALEAKVESMLAQLMAGALKALGDANCALVGGHTAEGPELSMGFSVNGVMPDGEPLRKGGLREGDALILTKPIGTGTLFAANMRLKAKGEWIDAALGSMLISNKAAGTIARRFGARACTDVTGFGVMGHLAEMLRASPGVRVVLDASKVPLLEGALSCVRGGVFSSLQPQNLRQRRILINEAEAAASTSGVYPLLFDPQTAGGLMFGVPAGVMDDCLRTLRDAGYVHAASIGRVVACGDGGVVLEGLSD